MSTTTDPFAPPRLTETAPSAVLADAPGFARVVGYAGLFLLVAGLFFVISNEALGPRWVGKGGGYLFAAAGVALTLYHAARDAEQDVRRLYGLLALVWLVLAAGAAVVPGPLFTSGAAKAVGFNLVPYGVGFACLALLYAVPFVRSETDPKYHTPAVYGLLGVGAALAFVGLVCPVLGNLFPALGRGGQVFRPDFLAGPGLALALLGLAYLCAFLGQADTGDGLGRKVAVGLGVLGGAVALYALARAAVPTLLVEGPAALRTPAGDRLDKWRVLARAAAVLAAGGLVWAAAVARGLPVWVRSGLAAVGVAGVAVLVAASVKGNLITVAPPPFLIPAGLILIGVGLVYLGVSVAICSDNVFVALTRRELAAYFLSPIGYLVLGGMVLVHGISYGDFVDGLSAAARRTGGAIQEPIVSRYFYGLLPVIALVLMVPALTMRLIAEERRTGSLEVLLTAPVNETPVVLSKFLATWLFFMACWVPAGLFLVALRIEAGPFDYRPLLSFYAALAAQGLAFVGMGLFFSALTRDQIVAAVLTLVGMLFFILCYIVREGQETVTLTAALQTALGRLSFIHMWGESLAGQLPLRDVLLFVSVGGLFVFLAVKVLEMRKWN